VSKAIAFYPKGVWLIDIAPVWDLKKGSGFKPTGEQVKDMLPGHCS
jgi:hypothetical protein